MHSDAFEIRVNEEYASLVPKLPDAEFQSLKASIRERGLMQSIAINSQHIILDGHNRYNACKELGIPVRYVVRDFRGDSVLEKLFIIESNCVRRHLNPIQRVEIAIKAEPIYAELAKKRRLSGLKNVGSASSVQNCTDDNEEGGRVIDLCAKVAGVSASYYNMAKKVLQYATSSELEEMRDGKKSVNNVYKSLLKKSVMANNSHPDPRKVKLGWLRANFKFFLFNEIQDIEKIPDQNVDLVINLAHSDRHDKLVYAPIIRFAKKALKKDVGALFIRVGKRDLQQVISIGRDAGLNYVSIFVAVYKCHSCPPDWNKIISNFEPILVFTSNDHLRLGNRTKVPDVIVIENADAFDESRVSEYIIKKFSPERGLICDPLMGDGKTAEAAVDLRRQFTGAEIDRELFELANRRLASLVKKDSATSVSAA